MQVPRLDGCLPKHRTFVCLSGHVQAALCGTNGERLKRNVCLSGDVQAALCGTNGKRLKRDVDLSGDE